MDEKYLGHVWNGGVAHFKVPVTKDDHKARVKLPLSPTGDTKTFKASPGEEVVLTTGLDVPFLIDGSAFRNLVIHPVGRAKLRVYPAPEQNKPLALTINSRVWNIESGTEFQTYDWAPMNRLIRLEVETGDPKAPERQVVFVQPRKLFSLRTSNHDDNDTDSTTKFINSVNYFIQLRLCVAHHVSNIDDNTVVNLEWLANDLRLIQTRGVMPEVVALREKYIGYFNEIDGKFKSAGEIVGGNLAANALEFGATALLTIIFQNPPPTLFECIGETISSFAQAGFEVYKNRSELAGPTDKLKAAEDSVVELLRRELKAHPAVKDRPEVKEIIGLR